MALHPLSRPFPWLLALCVSTGCGDDGDQGDDDGLSVSEDTANDEGADQSATSPTDASDDDDDDDGDDGDDDGDTGSDSDPETTDPDTTDSDTSDPEETGNDDDTDTGQPGDTVYEEPFDGAEGSAWPAPWSIVGTHIIDAEIDGGRGRMSGENNLTARLALGGLEVMDADVTIRVEYEDFGHQGYGFYVRQNGGALLETNPPGQGYGVYAEGGNLQSLGIWKEIAGVENPILEVPGAVPGGVDSGVPYNIRFQCEQQGANTSLRAKMWRDGDDEPANWMVETTDSSPELQNLSGSFANDVYNYQGTGSVWVHHVTISAL